MTMDRRPGTPEIPARARSGLRFRSATTPAVSCSTISRTAAANGWRSPAPPARAASRTLRRGLAMGPRLPVAGLEARRPHPDVPRRYAGLSGRVLRRGAVGLRAAADQHADAAGPAAVLSVGCRRDRGGRRRRVCPRFDAVACKDTPLQTLIVVNGAASEHAGQGIAANTWLQGLLPPISRRPTPTATRWRSGCIRRARPGGPRASCICSTTWPIARRRSRATCSS